MRKYKLGIFTLVSLMIFSCAKDTEEDFVDDGTAQGQNQKDPAYEVEDFFYRTMSDVYLYNELVPVLADDRFSSIEDKYEYFDTFSSPDRLFNKLKSSNDKYSRMIEDYREENRISMSASSNGLKYGLVTYCQSCPDIFGYVRYVVPNSSADEAGAERGMIFNRIDGQMLNRSNYLDLLSSGSFSIGLAKIVNNNISNLDQTIEISNRTGAENPVFISKTLEVNGVTVGYLLYDSFEEEFDEELNQAFRQFKSADISELVLDLRYNGGGDVQTAVGLASMITGQFQGEIFMKEQWNAKYQAFYESKNPEYLVNRFQTKLPSGSSINSLNLDRLFVLTTGSTASASELIINGLDPYINVVHIGDVTTGKFQASSVLYDAPSPTYKKEEIFSNVTHHYALQPLVLKSSNVNGVSDYSNGLNPDIKVVEDFLNLGQLGDPNETLLKIALDEISGNQSRSPLQYIKTYRHVGESDMFKPNYKEMIIKKKPLPVID